MLVRASDGRAVADLTENDFKIGDHGKLLLPVTHFRNLRPPQKLIVHRPPQEYTISNRPLAAFEAQQPVNIVILDTRNTDPEFQPWMRSQALRLISLLRPDADIAFYQLTLSGMRLLHEFSHDKAHLQNAVRNAALDRESSFTELRMARDRTTCEAISKMAEYMATLRHRKNLVWMAADFPAVFASSRTSGKANVPECSAMVKALNRNNVSLYPVDLRSPVAGDPFQPVAPGKPENVPRARRHAWSPEWLNTMATLAALTGGRAIENRSQLAEAMTDALAETRFAYEVGFRVPEPACDGELHPLNVRVTVRDALVIAKRAFTAECGTLNEPARVPAGFDATGIGLSVIPSAAHPDRLQLQMKLLIAAADLKWEKNARVEIAVKSKTGTLSKQTVTLTPPDDDKQSPVAVEVAARTERDEPWLRVEVSDKTNGRTGSVTLPLHNQPQ